MEKSVLFRKMPQSVLARQLIPMLIHIRIAKGV